jgi:hypothetical protein
MILQKQPPTTGRNVIPTTKNHEKTQSPSLWPRWKAKLTANLSPYIARTADYSSPSPRHLVRNIRLNEGSSSMGMLSKQWDFTIYDNTEYRDDLRAASGIGRRQLKVRVYLLSHP